MRIGTIRKTIRIETIRKKKRKVWGNYGAFVQEKGLEYL